MQSAAMWKHVRPPICYAVAVASPGKDHTLLLAFTPSKSYSVSLDPRTPETP